jgi:hypothetical protein
MADVKISQISNEVSTPTDDMLIEIEEEDGTSGKMTRANFLSDSADVVDDTTPQLGGNLDVNGFDIVSASNGNIEIIPDGSGKIRLGSVFWPTAGGGAGQVPTDDGSGNLNFSNPIILGHGTFSSASSPFDPSTDTGLHAQVDASANAVNILLPSTTGISDGTQLWIRCNSAANLVSISVAVSGQLRSRNFMSDHDHTSDTVFVGLSQATQEGSWAKIWKEAGIWQVAGLIRENSTDDINITAPGDQPSIAAGDVATLSDTVRINDTSAGVEKKLTFNELFDLEISQPDANFTVSATTEAKTMFAPTAGSICTIEPMRVGQVVPIRNVSGGTYTFADSGVTLTGATSVANNKAASIEAITTTSIFISAEA